MGNKTIRVYRLGRAMATMVVVVFCCLFASGVAVVSAQEVSVFQGGQDPMAQAAMPAEEVGLEDPRVPTIEMQNDLLEPVGAAEPIVIEMVDDAFLDPANWGYNIETAVIESSEDISDEVLEPLPVELPLDTDSDNDGISDYEEMIYGTDPNGPDTDADGVSDADELANGTDPNIFDTDGDYYDDGVENNAGSNPLDPLDVPSDGDDDYISDWEEINDYHTDPRMPDSDKDGWDDGHEVVSGTDPNDPDDFPIDSDGDGVTDGMEEIQGTDPCDPNDYEPGNIPEGPYWPPDGSDPIL